jgi:hypothetical protein
MGSRQVDIVSNSLTEQKKFLKMCSKQDIDT